MLWNRIRTLAGCSPFQAFGSSLLLLRIPADAHGTHWLIGPYKDLASFATRLRTHEEYREALGACGVRLGLRQTDVAPAGVRQKRYGTAVAGAMAQQNFHAARAKTLATPVRPSVSAPANRVTDQLHNVDTYWRTQTPQSHHIVEYNNLHALGKSQRSGASAMDHPHLPAVLLAAEFHQRYISSKLKPTHRLSRAELEAQIDQRYKELYTQASPLFAPLWDVSKAILEHART